MQVTVGICVFNGDATLRRALDSALSQRFEHSWEIIVVDDGSTDLSATIAAEYAFHFPDIVRLIRQENGGVGVARNAVIANARGDYLTWLDADDHFDTFRLEAAYRHTTAAEAEVGELIISYANYTRNGSVVAVDEMLSAPLPHLLRGDLCAYLWATMARTKIYRDLGGFNPELRRCEDVDLFIRFVKAGGRFVHVDGKPNVHYSFSANGRSGPDAESSYRHLQVAFSQDYEKLDDVREYRSRRLWEISGFYAAAKDWENMWRCRGEAMSESVAYAMPRLMTEVSKEINSKIAASEKRVIETLRQK